MALWKRESRKRFFFRLIKSAESSTENEIAFFVLTVKNVASGQVDRGYDEYRTMRSNLAQIYANECAAAIRAFETGDRHFDGTAGSARAECSEDMIYMEQTAWTDEERRATAEECRRWGIMRDDLMGKRWKGEEYPVVDEIEISRPKGRSKDASMNRQQRRAMAAIARRARIK